MQQDINLPVSPTQVNQQNWVYNNLPYQPPFIPQINMGQLQQFLPLLTGYAMLTMQNNVSKSQLRVFSYNLCSANGYQNNEFATFVATAAEYAEVLIVTRRMAPEEACKVACEELGSIFVALNVKKYAGLRQFVNPQIGAELQQWERRFMDVRREIEAYQNQGQNGGQWGGPVNQGMPMQGGWNGGPPMNPAYGYGNPAGGQHWAAPRQMNPMHLPPGAGMGMFAQPGMGMPMYGNPGMGNQLPQGMGGGYGYGGARPSGGSHLGNNALFNNMPSPGQPSMDMRGSVTFGMGRRKQVPGPPADAGDELTFAPGEPTTKRNVSFAAPRDDQGTLRPIPTLGQRAAPTNWSTGPAEEEYISIGEINSYPKVSNLERPFDALLIKEGIELRPAFKSGWTRSFTDQFPYHRLYDPSTHILFHLKGEDNTVIDVVKERNADMNYLDNEIDPKLRAQYREEEANKGGPVVATNNTLVVKMMQHPKLPLSTVVADDEIDDHGDVERQPEPVTIETVVQGHNLEEIETKIAVRLPEGENLKNGRNPVEYYGDLVKLVPGNPNMIASIKQLLAGTTFDDFKLRLLAAHTQEQLSDEVFNYIDVRVAEAITEALNKDMGLPAGWGIDRFTEDFVELCEALTSSYGKNLVEAMRRRASDILGRAVSVLSGDAFQQYLKSLDLDGAGAPPKFLVFRERVSVTHVPWKMERILATMGSENGGVVMESELPTLHAALKAIITRTSDQTVPFARRYMVLGDGQRLEIRRGFFGTDTYLLYKS